MKKLLTSASLLSLVVFSTAQAETLPLKRITISSAGLSQLYHQGELAKDAKINIPAQTDQVDDLLKSLVILDTTGQVQSVSLPGKQPLSEQFKNFPFTQEELDDPFLLLKSLQGASVSIDAPSKKMSGKLVNISQEVKNSEFGQEVQYRIMVLDDGALKHVLLSDLNAIEFTDKKLQDQLVKALTLVGENKSSSTRDIEVRLSAPKDRSVSYSYVVNAPLWKTAYRVVLPEGGQKGFLQGWGILENMTGQDWNNVELTLTSGAPVTYQQALYESYYTDRPILPVEVFGRILPRRDQGAVSLPPADALSRQGGVQQNFKAQAKALSMPAPAMMEMAAMSDAVASYTPMGAGSMGGLALNASASDGAVIEFTLPQKVSLANGNTMMVPFISHPMDMESVYVYQEDVDVTHPLQAVTIKNNEGHGLPPGITTIYNAKNYIGDAQMPVIPSKEDRMLPYALDTKTKISKDERYDRYESNLTNVNGVLKLKVKQVRRLDYTIDVPENEARDIVLEIPRVDGWDVKVDKGITVKDTTTHHRVYVSTKQGEDKKVTVLIERNDFETMNIYSLTSDRLAQLALTNPDAKSKAIFDNLAKMRKEVDAIDQNLSSLHQQRAQIVDDQERLRKNLETVSSRTDLGGSYVKKLEEQEAQLSKIDAQIISLDNDKKVKLKKFEEALFSTEF